MKNKSECWEFWPNLKITFFYNNILVQVYTWYLLGFRKPPLWDSTKRVECRFFFSCTLSWVGIFFGAGAHRQLCCQRCLSRVRWWYLSHRLLPAVPVAWQVVVFVPPAGLSRSLQSTCSALVHLLYVRIALFTFRIYNESCLVNHVSSVSMFGDEPEQQELSIIVVVLIAIYNNAVRGHLR